jgi:hypothetical protein
LSRAVKEKVLACGYIQLSKDKAVYCCLNGDQRGPPPEGLLFATMPTGLRINADLITVSPGIEKSAFFILRSHKIIARKLVHIRNPVYRMYASWEV